MHKAILRDQIPSTSSMEYMMTSITQTLQRRSGNEAGNIKEEYTVALPDGRIQYVIYHADGSYGGTIMEVKYDGEARHPDAVHHGGHGHGGGIGGGHGIVG